MNPLKKYRVVNGTSYNARTPEIVVQLLEKARVADVRLRIQYGDVMTGKSWMDDPEEGYIGRSTGETKIPLLVHNKRSMGGDGIMDHHIVKIEPTRKDVSGFRWNHPRFWEANTGRRLRLPLCTAA